MLAASFTALCGIRFRDFIQQFAVLVKVKSRGFRISP
jgi:hypothetical protein